MPERRHGSQWTIGSPTIETSSRAAGNQWGEGAVGATGAPLICGKNGKSKSTPTTPAYGSGPRTNPASQIDYAFSLTRPGPDSTAWTTQKATAEKARGHRQWLKAGIKEIMEKAKGNPGILPEDLLEENLTRELEE